MSFYYFFGYKLKITILAFIYSISLYCMVWPSILPSTSLIAVALNTLAIISALLNNRNIKLKSGGNKFFIVSVYVFITSCILIFSALTQSSATGLVIKLYIFLTFILLVLTLNQDEMRLLFKSYIIYAVTISTLGIAAFTLINFQYVLIGDFPINMTEITSGKIPRTQDNLKHDYDAPYYMALVYTLGIQKVNIVHFLFYPSTGWSHEPQIAALISTPALILLSFRKSYYFGSLFRVYGCGVIILFLATCFSLSNMIALICCYVFHLLRSSNLAEINAFSLIKNLVVMGVVFFLGASAISTPFIESKLSDSISLQNAISQFSFANSPQLLSFMLALSIIGLLIFILILVFKIQYEGPLKKSITLILVYCTVHSLKGSMDTVSQYMLFAFFVINGIQNLTAGIWYNSRAKAGQKEFRSSVV